MGIRKIALYVLGLSIGFTACKKNDNGVIKVEERDRGEQQIVDNDSIVGYLETHYYNSSDFASNPDPSINDLVITELPEGETVPDGNTLLMDAVETKTTVFADTDYEYYILKLNQGGGESPTFADDIRVIYEGFLLNEEIFDSRLIIPSDFDLVTGIIPGWGKVFPYFNTAESFSGNGDGTVDFVNSGVGVMFLPSGLAYFSSSPSTDVPPYSPLIFKFELLQMSQNDHDGDKIPSFMEDLNGDGTFTVNFDNLKDTTDDDTDGDGNADYADQDDDNDGILTKDEITVKTYNEPTKEAIENMSFADNEVLIKIKMESDGTYTGTTITLTDSDGDGIADYLDNE